MGGLVVKRAYLNAQNNPRFRQIGTAVRSMIFLSTPHTGADSGSSLKNLMSVSFFISEKQFVNSLQRNSETLETINQDFRHFMHKLFIASFYETRETPIFPHLDRINPTKVRVVKKDSSRLMCPGEVHMSLDADHHGVCKYTSRQDPNYGRVLNMILKAVQANDVSP
ncbi:hypothetical protein EJ06DRAFT_35 [Trichodelitschia bisporula]|uniref:DUF676 domain-containing protein n=1 Tax=Trichodelitschia bisporula TaxID=703511 RepID=A0A6G1I9T3_9PEZI|nr:hypothetical protein EJ06DRAFT_35 [Trichodelitschia bisporula]